MSTGRLVNLFEGSSKSNFLLVQTVASMKLQKLSRVPGDHVFCGLEGQ